MKKFCNEKPILASILIVILFWSISRAIGFLWGLLPSNFFNDILVEIINIIIPFVFVLMFGDVKIYTKKGFVDTLFAGAYLFVIEFLYLGMVFAQTLHAADTQWQSPIGVILGILIMFGIGFREESVFRGITVTLIGKKYIKDRKGIFITAWATGLIFGLIHITNVFSGVNFTSALIQSIVAAGGGFYLGAIYLRGGSIWAMILMHAMTDAASMFGAVFTLNSGTMVDYMDNLSPVNLTPFFIFTGIGFFLLRKKKCDEIISKFNEVNADEVA